MKMYKSILGIAAIFLLGVMAGVLGTNLVFKQRFEKGPPPIDVVLMHRLSKRLDLTPAQQTEVRKILDNLRVRLKEIRQDYHPRVKAAFDARFDQIRQHLTESQRAKMDIFEKHLPKHLPFDRKRHHRSKRDENQFPAVKDYPKDR